MKVIRTVLIGSLGVLLGTGAALADTPRDWLNRMSLAMSQISYQGTFVYMRGGEATTMRVTHLVDGDGVRERLVTVSGAPRELVRDASGVRWALDDKGSVLEEPALNMSVFPEMPPDLHEQILRSYDLSLGSTQRISGLTARNLKVTPRDSYRYGYSLWLEQDTALPLQWTMLGEGGRTLARLMFTDIRLGPEVDPSELAPSGGKGRYPTIKSSLPAARRASITSLRWQPSRLPSGFKLAAHRLLNSDDDGLYEHLLYSDGLAAVSIYIESGPPADNGDSQGQIMRIGTAHAFTRPVGDATITVVGDVPAKTVEMIGSAMSRTQH